MRRKRLVLQQPWTPHNNEWRPQEDTVSSNDSRKGWEAEHNRGLTKHREHAALLGFVQILLR